MAIDEAEKVGNNIENDEAVDGLLVSDTNDVYEDKEQIDGGGSGNENDENENDDQIEEEDELDKKEKKDQNDDEDSSHSSKSESDREGNEQEEEEENSSSAIPSIHFFFNFVNAVEFSDCSHDRSLWTLKSFKEFLKTSLQSSETEVEKDSESESIQRVQCAKVFFIFRELNAIVGTALIYLKDLLVSSQDSDAVMDVYNTS